MGCVDLMRFSLLLAVALLVITGCGKKTTPPAPADAQSPGAAPGGSPPPPPPKYVAATAENAPTQNVPGEVNAFLTEQLRIFTRDKRRLPESFAELTRARLDSVPRPPAGKKWVIDTATTEVKAVAAQ